MVRKLVIAVAMVAVMAVPSFAAVQNVKVGGDIKTTSVIRDNFNLGSAAPQATQNVFLSQVGLNVQADLTDNVSTNMRLTNERLFGDYSAGTADSQVNFDTAYVTMKELMYAPLTVTIGRQPLQYGNQLLIGDGDLTTNVAAVDDITGGVNFDAIKAVLSYEPLTVDLFAAKINEVDAVGTEDKGDTDLYGVNANYKFGDKMNSIIEAYTFARINKDVTGTSVTSKPQTLYVPGLRLSTNPIEGLNVQLEGAYELGKTATADDNDAKVGAFALQGIVNYALPVMKDMKPVLSLSDTYYSGDKNTTDTKVKTFNALYNNQEVGRIWSNIFAKNNLNVVNAAISLTPVADLTAKLSWYGLTQVYKTPAASGVGLLAAADLAASTATAGRSNRLGSEVDLDLSYAYTEDVTLGVSGGMFFGGKKIANDNNEVAKQLLTSVDVKF